MSSSTLYIDNIYNKAGNGGPNFSNGITTSNVNGGQLSGFRNLIINGNFQVNQRGAASITATSSDYNYDRWYYDGTYLYQGVEDKNVFNGTYTLSWQDAGSDITASYVVSTDTTAGDGPDSGLTWTTVSNGGNITVNEATEYSKHLWIRFGGTLTNLSKVQLETGSTATPFEHRPYGVELALCQRYYQKYIGYYQRTDATASITYHPSNIVFPVVMRTTPEFTGENLVTVGSYGIITTTSVTATSIYDSKFSGGRLDLSSAGSGFYGNLIYDAEL